MNRGYKAEQAGNALNSMLINISGGREKATKALNELGISAYDAEGNFIGLESIIRQYTEATKDMTQEQKEYYATQIAGKTMASTWLALINGMSNEYDDLKESIEGADGALNDMYNTQSKTMANLAKSIQSKFEAIGIRLIETFEEPITKIMTSIDELLAKIVDLPEGFYKWGGIIAGILASLGSVLTVVGTFIMIGGRIIQVWGNAFTKIGKAIDVVKKGFTALATTLGLSTGWLAVIIAAIAALVAALISAYNHCEKFR